MTPAQNRLTRTSLTARTGRTSRTAQTAERTEVATSGRAVVGLAVGAAKAGAAARAAVAAGWQWCRRTFRPAGVLVLLVAVAGLGVGGVFGWVEAVVAGVAAAVLLILGIPFLFQLRTYAVSLTLDHDRIVAGTAAQATVTVHNPGGRVVLPGQIDLPIGDGLVEFGVPLLRGGAHWQQRLELPPQRRGIVRIGPATTIRSDPIGLLHREHAFADTHDLFVHPRTTSLPSTSTGLIRDLDGSATTILADADMSFHAIREYAPGDSRRQVHWKSTAKTGRLMVRQYEQTRRSRMAVVLPLAAAEYSSDAEFELAVSAAASLAVRAVYDARESDLVVGAEIPRVVRGRLRAIRRIPTGTARTVLDGFSAVEKLSNTMPMPEVCRLVADAGERLSIAVLVTGSQVPLSALRAAALAFPVDVAVIAVVCDERAHPRTQVFGALTILTIGTLDDLAGLLLRAVTS